MCCLFFCDRFMPKHKTAHLQKMLSLKENGGAPPSMGPPFQTEPRESGNTQKNVKSQDDVQPGLQVAQEEILGISLVQETGLAKSNSSANSSSHLGETLRNLTLTPCGILGEVDDQQRPLHIVWPHRW